MKHLNIRVTGKVQGVFFRANTQKMASEMGIQGWVRNEPDGSVYVEAEGDDEKMKPFVEWLHQGSEQSRVDQVLVEESDLKDFKGFEIKR
ncbi:acylphosphatase [Fulvivirga maritima]|uniref:acylphosphatase n=1 Tax=Fulvivirga maritima TaxID=2904247 RepID=UPI001F33C218|nr:acylphosphatase [Fulvivirga maritima]UII27890.1 acylphosphatase [Fulvivirga maritima]